MKGSLSPVFPESIGAGKLRMMGRVPCAEKCFRMCVRVCAC